MNDPNATRAADTPPPACSAPDETPHWLITVAVLLLITFVAAVTVIGFAYGTVAGCSVIAILAFWLLRSIASVMKDHQEKPNDQAHL